LKISELTVHGSNTSKDPDARAAYDAISKICLRAFLALHKKKEQAEAQAEAPPATYPLPVKSMSYVNKGSKDKPIVVE